MLKDFQGIIDSQGLRTFRQSASSITGEAAVASTGARVPFWAVIEEHAATSILREMMLGSRQRALRLLEEAAISIGSEPLR